MAGETDRVTLDPNSFADAIKMIMKNFLRMTCPRKSSKGRGSLVIDIQLLSEGDFYTVKMTHCGRWTEEGIGNMFDEFIRLVNKGLLPNSAVLAYVFERSEGRKEEVVYEIKGGDNFDKKNIVMNNTFVHFPSFKNYVSIKLQYRLSSRDLSEFKDILVREFNGLKDSHRDVKITFYFEEDVFYSNHVASDDDFKDCQLLGSPLIDVVRQSMNIEFKQRCLKNLKSESVHDAKRDLARTLFSMIHENYIFP